MTHDGHEHSNQRRLWHYDFASRRLWSFLWPSLLSPPSKGTKILDLDLLQEVQYYFARFLEFLSLCNGIKGIGIKPATFSNLLPEIHESKEARKHEKKGKVEKKRDHEHPFGFDPPPLNVKHHHRVVKDVGNILNGKIQEIL